MKDLVHRNKKINIAIIDSSIYRTGARNSILEYIKKLDNKYNFFLISPYEDVNSISNLTTICFEYKNLHRKAYSLILYPFQLIKEVLRLNKIAKINQVTIFHFNDLHYLHGIFLKLFGYKIIYHIRLLPSSYIGKPYKFYIKMTKLASNKVLVVSQYLKNYYNNKKAVLLYDRIKFKEMLPSFKVNKNQKLIRVLVVGNYVPGKGHDHAIRSMYIAQKNGFRGSLCFYGDDLSAERMKYKYSLKKLAIDLNSANFHTSFKNKEEVYKNHDVLLNLSESESFSLVNLEAMYYGLPTISADSEGPCEQILNNETGYLVNFKDYKSVARILLNLESNIELRTKISNNAKVHVRKLFSTDMHIKKLQQIYDQL